jgi:hypothetical protein
MAESEVEKELKVFDKELDAIIAIKEKIETNFCKSKEHNKKEDREFQVEVLRLQLKYENVKLVMTVVLSLVVSLLAVIATIIANGDFKPEVSSLLYNLLDVLIALTIGVAIFTAIILYFWQKGDLDKLKKFP